MSHLKAVFLTTTLAAVLFSAIPQAAATDERPAGEFTFIVNGKPAPSTQAASVQGLVWQ
ncbi:hypothetical protein [Xanthomonas arboricola]|uniref:hypothetical protein n=1 Tax=Xanthomonas arboricola TaxID=56448 RepID=UPI000A73DF81|nr:hypothetical protein [Xanthomonas arboricola]